MKLLENYCEETRNRIRSILVENGKKNGFQKGDKHPKWNGGIKRNVEGYILVLVSSDSPYYKMSDNGYIRRGRLIMAESLGRCINPEEVVHHISGIRDDDRIENLRLLKNHSEHVVLHHKLRKLSK